MAGGEFSTSMGNCPNGFVGQLLGITGRSSVGKLFGTPMTNKRLSDLANRLREASEAYYAGEPSPLSDACRLMTILWKVHDGQAS